MDGRPPAETLLRRLRSHLPTSPLPWHWHVRINRGLLIAIAVLAVGGALASVLLQGSSSSSEEHTEKLHAPPQVRRAVQGMSAQAKADQVIAAGFDDPGAAATELGSEQLGGVLVRPQNGRSGGLLSRLRTAGASGGRIAPLLIADQGLATRPPAAIKAEGFDLVLAPVADVATSGSPIADQAFSDDPAVVTDETVAAVKDCAEAEIACAVSHFPGLGAASGDTADAPATVGLDADSLEQRDLEPFRAAFRAHVPAVVLSLAFYAAYDPVTPAALSPRVANELLRGDLHFDGLAISDDLSSGAISAGIGAPEAAVEAVAAGTDLVVVGDPAEAERAREALVAAAVSGQIPKDRLDAAAARVLTLKQRLGLLPAA